MFQKKLLLQDHHFNICMNFFMMTKCNLFIDIFIFYKQNFLNFLISYNESYTD